MSEYPNWIASSTTLFTILFRNSQLLGSYCHVSRSAAQPRHSSTPLLPAIEFAQGPRPPQIAGGFLQVVVSKAREHTVLVQAHCLSRFRYNPKTYQDLMTPDCSECEPCLYAELS